MQGEHLGESLIFIMSQPRAGSTLLQRMLGSHPEIHTVSEPWLMLHPFYALRPEGYQAEYSEILAHIGVQGFLQALPDEQDEYYEGVRRMYTYLYQSALAGTGKRYFLDKTPRYYFVISELYRTFPKAHYIILLRNPVAALCSVLKTRVKKDWLRLYRFKHDLIWAPRLLLKGVELLGEHCVTVNYEQLVKEPQSEVRRICGKLGVDFEPSMIEYGRHSLPHWRSGDQAGVYRHSRPTSQYVEKWIQSLRDPQMWRLTNDYLQLLGQPIVQQMGYRYEELREVMEAHRPHKVRSWLTFSLAWLLKAPLEERKMWVRVLVRLTKSLRRRGVRGTAVAMVHRVADALSNPV